MRKLVLLMLSLVILTSCYAQRRSKRTKKVEVAPVEVVTQEEVEEPEVPVVTEECLINLSLFNESAKNKQFADAYEPWLQVFTNCPNANRAVYSQGRNILHWRLEQTTDDAKYQSVFDELMFMYDQRMKYFGDDPKYPTPWIKGLKALDYILYKKDDALNRPAYQWLEEALDGLLENSEIEMIRQFVVLSDKLYADDASHAEKYIADYLKANEILESIIKSAEQTNPDAAAQAVQYKNGLDIVFAESGAANCETLDGLYADKILSNGDDFAYLNKIISFYRRVKCLDSKVYFEAAEKAHKVQPTAESASALAVMTYNQDQFQRSINYYDEATRLSDVNEDKADFQYKIAQIYYSKLSNYPRTKAHAINALEFNPALGSAHMIIGLAYAAAKGIFDDPVLAKSVYWVAVDRLVKAKQVDPDLKDDVDKLIQSYSRHFPSKEDIFFKPELNNGQAFYVGGWIGESTICR